MISAFFGIVQRKSAVFLNSSFQPIRSGGSSSRLAEDRRHARIFSNIFFHLLTGFPESAALGGLAISVVLCGAPEFVRTSLSIVKTRFSIQDVFSVAAMQV
jgi:hypothetical protein